MGLEKVVKELLDRGEEDAEAIKKEGEKEALFMMDEANIKAKKLREEKQKEARKKAQKVKQWELSSVEIEEKRIVLNAKKELFDMTYNVTLERLSALPKEKREKTIKTLISKASKEFKSGYVYCNEQDTSFVRGAANFKFGGNIDCIGGIVAENEEKTVKLDYQYETILSEIWKESLKQVSDILFG